jgi:hypothetical protein
MRPICIWGLVLGLPALGCTSNAPAGPDDETGTDNAPPDGPAPSPPSP